MKCKNCGADVSVKKVCDYCGSICEETVLYYRRLESQGYAFNSRGELTSAPAEWDVTHRSVNELRVEAGFPPLPEGETLLYVLPSRFSASAFINDRIKRTVNG